MHSHVPSDLSHAPPPIPNQPHRAAPVPGHVRILCVCHVCHIRRECVVKLLKHCEGLTRGHSWYIMLTVMDSPHRPLFRHKGPPPAVFLATVFVVFVLTLSAADSVGFVPDYIDGSTPL